ncbi:hypothetical protein CVD28_01965 [Bacillus sp. M6-12]|uniref:transglutaminase domain-containing protein n=1 Tax=Bacillus sp. M6-12 TaxID=2054166 RepID=UPI000C787DE6|nr:transglutaminase domain-containing protein [Bacillus sp. M6-12]PLS19198.1 hypothetical protein CVD28_01965 [Bacillus sp. M6-12]
MKKGRLVGMALSVGLLTGLFQPLSANAINNDLTNNTQYDVKDVQKEIYVAPYSKMESYMKTVKKQADNRVVKGVSNQATFNKMVDMMHKELPTQITFESSVPEKTLKLWYDEYQLIGTPSQQTNLHTLASYSLKKGIKNTYVLKDNSNDKYSAKQIEKGIQLFANDFALGIKNLPQDVKIHMVYNYIYEQFQYGASSYKKMMIGNAYNGKLACNGFSRLFYELAHASGIPVKMIESDDHFYNQVQTSTGKWVIIDTTTDILLKQKHGATGLAKEEYLNYVSKVGFYWAKPVSRESAQADFLDKEQKEEFLKLSNSLLKMSYK